MAQGAAVNHKKKTKSVLQEHPAVRTSRSREQDEPHPRAGRRFGGCVPRLRLAIWLERRKLASATFRNWTAPFASARFRRTRKPLQVSAHAGGGTVEVRRKSNELALDRLKRALEYSGAFFIWARATCKAGSVWRRGAFAPDAAASRVTRNCM